VERERSRRFAAALRPERELPDPPLRGDPHVPIVPALRRPAPLAVPPPPLAPPFAPGFALAPAIPRPALGLGSNLHGRHDARTLLSFHKMFGVDGAFVGEEHPIGGFDGDERAGGVGAAG